MGMRSSENAFAIATTWPGDPDKGGHVRVLLVDGHQVMRAGLRMFLEHHLKCEVVGEAGGRDAALAIAAENPPDLVLLELDLGAESGLDLMTPLLKVAPMCRILVLTGVLDPDAHLRSIGLGAMGIVLKREAPDTLLQAIETIQQGEVWVDRAMMARVLREVRLWSEVDPEVERIRSLTPREREVVTHIGAGRRNQDIADALFICEGTVRHHLSSIFRKLQVADRLGLMIVACRQGIVSMPTPHNSPLGAAAPEGRPRPPRCPVDVGK